MRAGFAGSERRELSGDGLEIGREIKIGAWGTNGFQGLFGQGLHSAALLSLCVAGVFLMAWIGTDLPRELCRMRRRR